MYTTSVFSIVSVNMDANQNNDVNMDANQKNNDVREWLESREMLLPGVHILIVNSPHATVRVDDSSRAYIHIDCSTKAAVVVSDSEGATIEVLDSEAASISARDSMGVHISVKDDTPVSLGIKDSIGSTNEIVDSASSADRAQQGIASDVSTVTATAPEVHKEVKEETRDVEESKQRQREPPAQSHDQRRHLLGMKWTTGKLRDLTQLDSDD